MNNQALYLRHLVSAFNVALAFGAAAFALRFLAGCEICRGWVTASAHNHRLRRKNQSIRPASRAIKASTAGYP